MEMQGEGLHFCDADLRNVLRSYNVKLFAKSSFLALPSEKNFALYQPQNDTLVWTVCNNLTKQTGPCY